VFNESRQLSEWISNRLETASSPEARRVLGQSKELFREYATNILDYVGIIEEGGQAEAAAALLDRAADLVEQLQALDTQLNDGQFEVTKTLVHTTAFVLELFRELLIAALLLLLILGLALARTTYRDWIVPLRAKLVRSEMIIERQEKLSALGILAAGIAHEIRNPMTSMKARLYAQRKSLPTASPEMEDNVVIGAEIVRLEQIVKGFLQFARPADPSPVVTHASEPLQEVAKLMAPGLEKSGVALNVVVVKNPAIRVDPHQLRQVLINLVQNGVESLNGDGRITLRTDERLERRVARGRPCAVLEVADNGKGIPREVQRRLFDPFFTTKENGTGLGLSIAARIIEQHGGALEYQTQLNRGTTFRILLPIVSVDGNDRQNPIA
jgi:signal transduction histidine kinase